jgi:hypothetical protein
MCCGYPHTLPIHPVVWRIYWHHQATADTLLANNMDTCSVRAIHFHPSCKHYGWRISRSLLNYEKRIFPCTIKQALWQAADPLVQHAPQVLLQA